MGYAGSVLETLEQAGSALEILERLARNRRISREDDLELGRILEGVAVGEDLGRPVAPRDDLSCFSVEKLDARDVRVARYEAVDLPRPAMRS